MALQHPLTALAILAPLCLLGEVLRLISGASPASTQLLGDPLLEQLGTLTGLHLPFVTLIVLLAWWLTAQLAGKHPWILPPVRAIGLCFAWGAVWMVCRLAVAMVFNRAFDSVAGTSGLLLCGAIQEELLFRGIILGLGLGIIAFYDAPTWLRIGLALPLSAVFFSLAHTTVVNHHPSAEAFLWMPFWERYIAGMIYGYAFIRQGLAVSTLAHLGYLIALQAGLARYVL